MFKRRGLEPGRGRRTCQREVEAGARGWATPEYRARSRVEVRAVVYASLRGRSRVHAVVIAVGLLAAGCGPGGATTPGSGSGNSGWTAVSGDAFAGSTLNDVAAFDKGFVTVGAAAPVGGEQLGGVWTSADGSAWTGAAPTTPFKNATVAVAVAAGDGILALGMPCSGECFGYQSWTTSNGTTWAGPVKVPGTETVVPTGFAPGNSIMVGIGDDLVDVSNGAFNGRVFTTPDGEAWTPVPDIAAMHDARLSAIAAAANGFVIVGSVKAGTGRAAAAWWSTDGVAWTQAAADPSFTDATLSSVVPGTSGYIAVGSAGSDGAVWTSPDGRTWARNDDKGAFAGKPLVDVATNGKGFVAIGGDAAGGSAWTSADGARWEPVPPIPGSAGARFKSVAVGTTASVIVGRPGPSGPDAGLVWFGPLP